MATSCGHTTTICIWQHAWLHFMWAHYSPTSVSRILDTIAPSHVGTLYNPIWSRLPPWLHFMWSNTPWLHFMWSNTPWLHFMWSNTPWLHFMWSNTTWLHFMWSNIHIQPYICGLIHLIHVAICIKRETWLQFMLNFIMVKCTWSFSQTLPVTILLLSTADWSDGRGFQWPRSQGDNWTSVL